MLVGYNRVKTSGNDILGYVKTSKGQQHYHVAEKC